jgi:hypothetical protein
MRLFNQVAGQERERFGVGPRTREWFRRSGHRAGRDRTALRLQRHPDLAAKQDAELQAIRAVEPIALGANLSSEASMTAAEVHRQLSLERRAPALERGHSASQRVGRAVSFRVPGRRSSARPDGVRADVRPRARDRSGRARACIERMLRAPRLLLPLLLPHQQQRRPATRGHTGCNRTHEGVPGCAEAD